MPRAIIVAGPNGAGKTTFAAEYLANEGACPQFVNADLIAAGLSPYTPDSVGIASGRALLKRLINLVDQRSDFAIETTLAGKWLLPHIRGWQLVGYTVDLYYLFLDSPDVGVQRVADRVRSGGHGIPDAVIRRRFQRSLEALSDYKAQVDHWAVYNNTGSEPRLIAAS